MHYGSTFVFKYSIVLIYFEAIFSFSSLHGILQLSGIQPNSTRPDTNFPSHGISALLLGWISFLSVDFVSRHRDIYFYIFGIVYVPLSIAPLIILVISQCLVSRFQIVSLVGGLLAGYLLAFHVLMIVPDIYWTFCISFDLVVFLLYCYLKGSGGSDNPTTTTGVADARRHQYEVVPVYTHEQGDDGDDDGHVADNNSRGDNAV
jgi:hypothetical protein